MTSVAMEPQFVTHESPVWRDKATTVLRAQIPNPPPDGGTWFEQLWGRRIDDRHYELCCIPFSTYAFALGDTVEVGDGNDAYRIKGVSAASGRVVLRAWLADSSKEVWDELQWLLKFRGLHHEFRKPALVAIDTSAADSLEVEAELQRMQTEGKLAYERGSAGYSAPASE